MKILISKSELRGAVKAPPSKSYTLRALMCAALARGESEIIHPLTSDDTEAACSVLSKVGVSLRREMDSWSVNGDNFHEPNEALFCRDSAATLRFMTAICSLIPGRCCLTAGPSLSKRPVKPLIEALRQLGVSCSSQNDVAPLMVEGGKLRGGLTELPGDVSSQFVSALLLIAPFAEEGIKIKLTTPLESKPYLLMTLECLKKFGIRVEHSSDLREFEVPKQSYKPARYKVEGDWSSASYLLALGAVAGEVKVENLNLSSLQADKIILDFLKDMGASVKLGRDSVTIKKSKLGAIKVDLSDCIDLLPTMAALAAVADGVSEFAGIERARLKESNRVSAVKENLGRMGIRVAEEGSRLTIAGSRPKGSLINTHDDHRIAMAFSILGFVSGKTILDNAECVSKTYPKFWDAVRSIGGRIEENE